MGVHETFEMFHSPWQKSSYAGGQAVSMQTVDGRLF